MFKEKLRGSLTGEKKTKNVYPSVHPLSLVTAEKDSLEEGEEKKKMQQVNAAKL